MTISEILKELAGDDVIRKIASMKELDQISPTQEVFKALINNLDNPSGNVRFWCLDTLIKKFGKELKPNSEILTPKFIERLADEDPPVVDRTIWALSITGPDSVSKLIDVIKTAPNDNLKIMCIGALSRNTNIQFFKEEVISLLTDALKSKNQDIQFWSMISLMDISPLRSHLPPPHINDYDFETVYQEVSTVAETFLKGKNPDFKEWSNTYLELIRNHWQKDKNF